MLQSVLDGLPPYRRAARLKEIYNLVAALLGLLVEAAKCFALPTLLGKIFCALPWLRLLHSWPPA
jgi:hypothetical protein